IAEQSPRKTARMAGLFYLIFILTTVLATYVRSQFIVSGDAATTANNILASQGLFRVGFVTELVSAVFFLLAAWALYVLLKPVNKNLALLFLLLNLGGVAVECINVLNLYAALQFLSGANYLTAFQTGQLQAMAMSYLNLYTNGFLIAQIFFSAWLLPLGYLVYKSRFLPKFLGLLLILDFFGNMSWFLQGFLLPNYGILAYPGNVISFIAEISLTLWLLIMAVKE
ncbi:MAG: DUF4386 domain-containing protein, partial [Halobacteriota archaeon]